MSEIKNKITGGNLMKAKASRVLAMLLTLVTIVGLFPASAFALEQGQPNTITVGSDRAYLRKRGLDLYRRLS